MNNTLQTINNIDSIETAQTINCSPDDLNRLIKRNPADITIVTQNIRSIYSNHNDLLLNLHSLKTDIDLITLTECRLDTSKPIPQIHNYLPYQTFNHLNKADGVVVYVKNTHKTSVEEVTLTHASCLQINFHSPNELTVLAIYRSPSKPKSDEFTNSLNNHLNTIASCKNIIVTGDININLIYNETEHSYDRLNRLTYLNMLAMHGLLPGHSLPTRGKNCLDHFMVKLDPTNASVTVAILSTTITDHSMIFLKMSNKKPIRKIAKTKTTINFDKAIENLGNSNLQNLINLADPNTICNLLINKIQTCLTNNTITTIIPHKSRLIKPWMTVGLLRCIQNRNSMQLKLKSEPHNEILKITFKRYRNYCNCIIKKQKRKHDRELFYKAHKNPKKIWETINNITHRKPSKTPNTDLFEIKATPKESANTVNKYFSNIGKILANEIIVSTTTAYGQNYNFDSPNVQPLSSFVLLNTDQDEVHRVLMSLKSDSAPGWDGITVNFLKTAHALVVPIITHLANQCFEHAIYPNALKLAFITPVHKSGDRANPSNYRPISVLPSISKIMERLINSRLLSYLNKNNLLSPSQYGFRQKMSTEDAVLALASAVTSQVDSGGKCLAVFLDLQKAFDTVPVSTLLDRLAAIGIRGVPHALLKDYLSERKQKIKIGNTISSEETVQFGVGQGSVLGPTLFLIYINTLCSMKIEGGLLFSYADDTAIVFSAATWDEVRKTAERGLARIAAWLDLNLLTLNTTKTNFICFTKYNSSQPPPVFKVKIHKCHYPVNSNCSCTEITRLESTKYLGIMVDQRLSWHNHTELIMKRIRKLIWTFKTLRHVTSKKLLVQIYISLAQSVLTYCIPVWGGATKIKFLDLERAQRSLLKVMFFKPFRFSTENLYRTSDLLTVRKLYVLNITLAKHKTLSFNPQKTKGRRKNTVAPTVSVKSTFAKRQYPRQSSHLYNLLNKELDIYPLTYRECKNVLSKWLKSKTYDQLENMVQSMKL